MPLSRIKTRTAEFFIDEHEILHVKMLEDVLVDELDVYDNLLVVRNLTEGKEGLRLVDARSSNWKMTEKAKEISKQHADKSKITGRAIIINSNVGRSVLNFLKFMQSTSFPQKHFTSYEEAIEWLLSLKK